MTMLNIFKLSGLERKLFVILFCLAFIPLSTVSGIFYHKSRQDLLQEADKGLTATTRLMARTLTSQVDKWFVDLHIQATRRQNIELMEKLSLEFKGKGILAADFVRGYRWLELTELRMEDIHSYLTAYNFQDMLLIDREGNILFSAANSSDLGSNLFNSADLADTQFAISAHKVLESGAPAMSDIKFYGADNEICTFLLTEMINQQGEKLGLIAFRISLSAIEPLIAPDNGAQQSTETVLTGFDGWLRSNTRYSSKQTALRHQPQIGVRRALREMEKSGALENEILFTSKIKATPFHGILHRLPELEKYGVFWVLFTRQAQQEALGPVVVLLKQVLFLLFLSFLLIVVVSRLLATNLIRPLSRLNSWVEQISSGNLYFHQDLQGMNRNDEFGQLTNNFSNLQKILQENNENNELENWHKDGKATLNALLRVDASLVDLADKVIAFLAGYVGAQVGTFFVRRGDRFVLLTGYAYTPSTGSKKSFGLGEGIIGQAALEGELFVFRNLPVNHPALRVDTGLGEVQPSTVVAVPLAVNEQTLGVVEFAASTDFGDKETAFLKNSAESIAIVLSSIVSRDTTRELLEKTSQQSHELQTQHEELQSANEELEEQTAELRRSQRLLQEQREELQATNEELEEKNKRLLRLQAMTWKKAKNRVNEVDE